jgi:hypothetical protein
MRGMRILENAMLDELFKYVDLPEIEGIDFGKRSHAEIALLLPAFGGEHPTKAILIDKKTGKANGIASGWDADIVIHEGMQFKAGAIGPEVSAQAGGAWATLGNHVEPVAAAFMRTKGIKEASLYINGRNPCWGVPDGTGCYYRLPVFLAEGSTMAVYNRLGQDFVASRPERTFHFTGLPD